MMEAIVTVIIVVGLVAGEVYLLLKLINGELFAPKFYCVECDKYSKHKCTLKVDSVTGEPKYCEFVRGTITCNRNAKRKIE